MKYYGVIGSNIETRDQTRNPQTPKGYIRMRGPQPTPQHIAVKHAGNRLGDWILPPEQVAEDETDTENAE